MRNAIRHRRRPGRGFPIWEESRAFAIGLNAIIVALINSHRPVKIRSRFGFNCRTEAARVIDYNYTARALRNRENIFGLASKNTRVSRNWMYVKNLVSTVSVIYDAVILSQSGSLDRQARNYAASSRISKKKDPLPLLKCAHENGIKNVAIATSTIRSTSNMRHEQTRGLSCLCMQIRRGCRCGGSDIVGHVHR